LEPLAVVVCPERAQELEQLPGKVAVGRHVVLACGESWCARFPLGRCPSRDAGHIQQWLASVLGEHGRKGTCVEYYAHRRDPAIFHLVPFSNK